jgi:hypothetical protein
MPAQEGVVTSRDASSTMLSTGPDGLMISYAGSVAEMAFIFTAIC